ncbi:MAG TPA: cyclodeaminase/cyclohydrolase family protein [Syntrophomonadaceae bacterium]|nr:cyclodeaminase/cyclohydrolase family protein [Syntrophomonadaceae bacterium]
MLMDMTVRDFLKELASNSPAPGGGSVSALAGSLAAALVSMVARLSEKQPIPDGVEKTAVVLAKAKELMAVLEKDVDADTEAFNQVMKAYGLPKGTEQEKEERSRAIQQALKGAALQPMKVARECLDVLELCSWAASHGNPNALSDAGVASLLAQAGLRGALYNVEINLSSIRDPEFKEKMVQEKEAILKKALQLQEELKETVESSLS